MASGVGEKLNIGDGQSEGQAERVTLPPEDSSLDPDTAEDWADRRKTRCRQESSSSIVDGLLFEIYDRWHAPRGGSFDSDTFTDISSTSDAFFGHHGSLHSELDQKHSNRFNRSFLRTKDACELHQIRSDIQHHITQVSARLIRQLKRRNRAAAHVHKHCEVITAILQAASQKRRVDSKIRFSLEPLPGDSAFKQWKDGMRAVARLPMGIPPEFRKKVWLALADVYIKSLKLDWDKTKKFAFNERSNPDDNSLGSQIVKDLHRTGCSGFSGDDNDEERALLKRVLLAYARWNKRVGYCQGFNVLAALILDVVDRREDDALKVMIFLVDNVLPESYFANNLRALSVDMAVFRDLLGTKLPKLSAHLDLLQAAARDDTTGANYEPPLTNVFTMQWFLTLFATCLPKSTALRVWDSVLLEGSEILLRTAVAIWGKLQSRILAVPSADEFYTTMGVLTQEMLDDNIINPDELVKKVYSLGPVPFQLVTDLREKYTYNITPFTAAMATGRRPNGRGVNGILSDEDDIDEDELMENINCFTGIFPPGGPPSPSKLRALGESDRSQSGSSFDISKASPGAYAANPENVNIGLPAYSERMSLDVNMLRNQYRRLRERQKQAHIILAAASARHNKKSRGHRDEQVIIKPKAIAVAPIESPVAVNHLFIGRKQGLNVSKGKNRTIVEGPSIAPLYHRKDGKSSTNLGNMKASSVASLSSTWERSSTSTLEPEDDPDVFSDSSSSKVSKSPCSSPNDSPCHMAIGSDKGKAGALANKCEMHNLAQDRDLLMLSAGEDSENDEHLSGIGSEDNSAKTFVDPSAETEENSPSSSENVDKNSNSLQADEQATSTQESSESKEAVLYRTMSEPSISADDRSQSKNAKSMAEKLFPDLSQTKESIQSEVSTTKQMSPASNGIHKPTLLEVASGLLSPGSEMQSSYKSPDLESDRNAQYVAKLTYKSHKVSQRQEPASPTKQNPTAFSCKKAPRIFNPFPSQHITNRRFQNGIKLGLYSSTNLPKFETGIIRTADDTNIGRAQHNACLHRQYMAEVKGQILPNSAKS